MIGVCVFLLQIQDLNLDNCRATQIEGLTDEFTNLTTLSLINVGLTTLKGFPNLPSLRKVLLNASDIAVSSGSACVDLEVKRS